jgi:hypothetical protein
MITVRTMKQIATSRTILSFRSSGSLSRQYHTLSDQGRAVNGYVQMLDGEALRQQRNRMWQGRCATGQ